MAGAAQKAQFTQTTGWDIAKIEKDSSKTVAQDVLCFKDNGRKRDKIMILDIHKIS